jgi:predicted transposase/invertase (TIGR01784 family)
MKGENVVSENLPPKEHDSTFKFLFEEKKDILLLIKDILKYKWAEMIDEDSIELVKTNYVTQDFMQIEADVIAKARLREREVYFYILIENQSTVKRDMQLRILKYMISLWAQEIRKGVEVLPAIIPIVVYNGIDERWNISTNLMEAFDIFRDDIFKYRVVDIIELDMKKFLEKQEDVLGPIVFYLEQVREDKDELVKRLYEIEANLKSLSRRNIDRFLNWAHYIIRPRLAEDLKAGYDKIVARIKEGGAGRMGDFVSNVARLLDETKTKEFNMGIQQGIQQGIYRAKVEMAKKLVKKGYSDDEIAELTELEVEEIRKLRRELVP